VPSVISKRQVLATDWGNLFMTHHKKELSHILIQNITQLPVSVDDIINEFYDFIFCTTVILGAGMEQSV
jgi:hypothetical protein